MAFLIRNLSVIGYQNGFTLWNYKSSKDTLSDISAADYFADACDMLTRQDWIMVNGSDGSRLLVVAKAEVEHVTTSSLS